MRGVRVTSVVEAVMGCGSAGRRAQDVCGCRHVKGRAWRFRIPLATLEGHGILIRGGLLRRRELGAAVTSRKRVNARAPVASLPKGRRGRHYIQWMGSANAGLPYHEGEEAQQGEHAAHWGVSLVVPGAGGRGGRGHNHALHRRFRRRIAPIALGGVGITEGGGNECSVAHKGAGLQLWVPRGVVEHAAVRAGEKAWRPRPQHIARVLVHALGAGLARWGLLPVSFAKLTGRSALIKLFRHVAGRERYVVWACGCCTCWLVAVCGA